MKACLLVLQCYSLSRPWRKIRERLRGRGEDATEGKCTWGWFSLCFSSWYSVQWKQMPARNTYQKSRIPRPPWTQCWGVWSRSCRTLELPQCPRAIVLPARNRSLARWDGPRCCSYRRLCVRPSPSHQGLFFLLLFKGILVRVNNYWSLQAWN